MVFHVGIGTRLQFGDHVFHPPAAFFAAHRGVHRHGCQVVAAHVAVQAVPVGIGRRLRLQAGLLAVRGQQAVAVILEQRPDVQVAGMLQRPVQQRHVAQGEFIGVQAVLRIRDQRERQDQQED